MACQIGYGRSSIVSGEEVEEGIEKGITDGQLKPNSFIVHNDHGTSLTPSFPPSLPIPFSFLHCSIFLYIATAFFFFPPDTTRNG